MSQPDKQFVEPLTERRADEPFYFRYSNNVPTNAHCWYGFSRLPTRTVGLPNNFFDHGTGKSYQTLMDQQMHAARRDTNGKATYGDYKAAWYRAEQAFRLWLLTKPPQTCLDFVRDFNDYDQRVALMMERYENPVKKKQQQSNSSKR